MEHPMGTGMSGRMMRLGLAALAVLGAAFVALPQGDGKGRDPVNRTSGPSGTARSTVPAIDLAVPEKTETAIFAMG